ncbi:hypothetical protein NAC44_19195 [Allorhizobium sp. BGMRC 0089]|uniref:hypothetical protein n=1 Tax=Allorhizobium sonneratiae TaxID=2934936 RepID=UPI002033E0EC|nr:hypothetical protein [Allorhizobium sonneratiae]MCM2294456.1 hypothetical protein [Allorhizobium sonneratiae]
MKMKIMLSAGLLLALAGCATTGSDGQAAKVVAPKRDALADRWVGQPAGRFFAQYGPPYNDQDNGSGRTYDWRGAYKTRMTGEKYEKLANGKRGKLLSPGRKQYLHCELQVTVSSDYVIRKITTVYDMPLGNGQTWCEQALDAG